MQKTLRLGGQDEVVRLFGPRDSYLKRLREAFDVNVVARGEKLRLEGPEQNVRRCEAALLEMEQELNRGNTITRETVERLVERQLSGPAPEPSQRLEPWPGVFPKSPGQAAYIRAMLGSEVVFCIGPAGTGKTYLGVAVALSFLKRGDLERIILCRPAVEAGENLGFLPGDVYAKVNPYLRPLYDALYEMIGFEQVAKLIERQVIEIAPLAYMRGRTLNNAYIILDESQNTTPEQMK
ncbi:MAG: PhoH family protein, partial [Candidatus Brocadiia bacterium]